MRTPERLDSHDRTKVATGIPEPTKAAALEIAERDGISPVEFFRRAIIEKVARDREEVTELEQGVDGPSIGRIATRSSAGM